MKHVRAEAGNVFFLILLGVALFAAFSAAVMSSSSKGGSSNPERDKLDATNVVKYGNTLKSAVDQMRSQGLSESDISFANGTVSGYGTVGANPAAEVFHFDGGGIAYEVPDSRWLDSANAAQTGYGTWVFTSANAIPGIGTPAELNIDCADTSCGDLIALLPYVKESVCKQINLQLTNNSAIPASEGSVSLTKHTGVFGLSALVYEDTLDSRLNGHPQGCINAASEGKYYYYHVLIAR